MTPAFRRHLPLAGVVAAAAVVLGVLATRVRDWIVMTDELQYAKLATEFAQGHVLPTVRGVHVSAYSQLYPALISPLWGTLAPPSALTWTHVVNALLFASAAVPAYLLAREADVPRAWSLVVAAATVVVPWNVLTSFVLTESLAYPVFLWTLWVLARALRLRTVQWDLGALAALGVAFFTRTQFVVLALVFPLAVLVVDGPRRALRRHVVVEACALAVVAAIVLAATGGVARVLGRYSVTATEGSIVSWKVLEQTGAHLDVVGVGIGLLPLLLGGAWLAVAAWRRNPFAALALLTIVLLSLETASYDVRFGGVLRDRYLFYVAPLLLVATACALRDGVESWALAAVTAFVAVTVVFHEFDPIPGLYVDSPVTVLNGVIHPSGDAYFVGLAAIVLALLVVRAPLRWRAPAVAAVVVVVAVTTSATAWTRLLTSHGPSGRPVTGQPGLVLDWADRVLPGDAHVGIVPYSATPTWALSALQWWDVEFWNRTVDRAYVQGETWDYAPFPHEQLDVDPETGGVGVAGTPRYAIVAASDARLRLAGSRVAQNFGLDILEPERPWRAEWLTQGLDPDGWTHAGRPATLRIFPKPGLGAERVHVEVRLQAPEMQFVTYRFAGRTAVLHMGETVTKQQDVCVAPPRFAQLELEVVQDATIVKVPIGPLVTGSRHVGPKVTQIAILHTGEPC